MHDRADEVTFRIGKYRGSMIDREIPPSSSPRPVSGRRHRSQIVHRSAGV